MQSENQRIGFFLRRCHRYIFVVIRCLGFCFLLLSLSLFLSLSLSFFPGGPAGAGALFLCCSSSLFRQAPTTSGRPLSGLSSALLLAPPFCLPFAPPFPPRRGRSPLLPAVFSSLSSCLSVFSLFPSLSISLSLSLSLACIANCLPLSTLVRTRKAMN